MNTKQIAIALVVILLAAGIAVAVISMTGNDKEDTSVELGDEGRLMIYGNANNDDYLDKNDVKYLQKIIDGEADETIFADANQDGVVDQKDIDFVNQMLKKEPMKIWYYNMDTKSADAVNYPIKKVVTILSETLIAMKILGVLDDVVGYNDLPDEVLFSDIPKDAVQIEGSGALSIETLSTTGADAVIVIPGSKYVNNEQEIEDKGIQVLRFAFRSAEVSAAYLTCGYLMQAEDRGAEYAHFSDGVLENIEKKVSASKYAYDRVRGMVLGYNVIYGHQSSYGEIIDMAGGEDAVTWYEHKFVSQGMEWLYNYDFDFIIGRVTCGGYDYTGSAADDADIQDKWDRYKKSYGNTDPFLDGNVVMLNTAAPDLIKVAYLAAAFYPDVFGEDYGDKVHQEYIDTFIDNLAEKNYKVTDGKFAMSVDDVNP